MSDDLVKRLREIAPGSNDGCLRGPALEAADRIEEPEAKLAKVREDALREASEIDLLEELRRRPSRPPKTGVEKRPLIEKDKTDE